MVVLLNTTDEARELSHGVMFARPLAKNSSMTFSVSSAIEEGQEQILTKICQPIVLLTLDVMTLEFRGRWSVEILAMSQITTLFSFLDFQGQSRQKTSARRLCEGTCEPLIRTEKNFALIVEEDDRNFIALVVSTLMSIEDRRLDPLFSFIRNIESYWVANFLLSLMMNKDKESYSHKICNASKKYGVSENYFRRLCYHAFARGPKKQLRIWRAAYSALQLIEGDSSIATIAGNNGYASSSHFSREIKLLFGITPRVFKNLGCLLHE
ncbi:TPA: helix-turn-helix domain-containing protein [Escherichia coli]|uniref:helix-turn-helix domain-containing protein n=1 Tax=Escherichia coli TaxID=562 RepID=UPI000BE2F34D|nr:helix-turn-helix domain-containing protein [Escherichia coli]MBS9316446.1 helix-turn-helix domain-containing protein [Escherichia coli]